ncbi:MAG: inorganic phosphate transporter [Anaerolineae bacterium]|nr:inorganic phosphate transporter [Anaerolineae bacterium]MDH7472473.1 inorganic phosphate transporter [Anaerolineae bacterium]
MTPSLLITVLIVVALIFDFLNGFHDSANIVSTMISSRAMRPRSALLLSAAAEFCGPFLFGVAVATTLGHEVLVGQAVTMSVILSALGSAIVWNLVTWLLGIPSSSSHALIGGLVGAAVLGFGFEAILVGGLLKVLAALLLSPLFGLSSGYLFMKLVLFVARGASPRINWLFKRAQVLTSLALALSHGSNDAQKTMGVITMGLVATGYLSTFAVPWWVVLVCAGAISLGTMLGGWRIIRTLGGKFYKIRPVHGFSTQVASAAVILGAALLGGPVSTTQVISSAIMGVGAAERISKVRWQVAGEIVMAWILTIPATALMSAILYWLIPSLGHV